MAPSFSPREAREISDSMRGESVEGRRAGIEGCSSFGWSPNSRAIRSVAAARWAGVRVASM